MRCSRKKGFRHLFTFIIKALTYTYVQSRLAHFTHSASIVWNRKTQRSLVRGCGTSRYEYQSYRLYNEQKVILYILCKINSEIVLHGCALPHQISSFICCHEDTSADHLTRFSILKNTEISNAAAVLKWRLILKVLWTLKKLSLNSYWLKSQYWEKQNVKNPIIKFKVVTKLWWFQNLIRWKYARGSYDVIWAFWNIKFNIFHLFKHYLIFYLLKLIQYLKYNICI